MGGAAVEGEDAVEGTGILEDGDASKWLPTAGATIAMMTSRPARVLRIRIRWGAVRAGSLRVIPPVKAAWCCQHVCGFRYARDMRRS
jgi:hypothetical protein